MAAVVLSLLLLACGTQAVLKLSPDSLTVLRGDQARFTCGTTKPTEWDVMLWELNNTVVVSISRQHGVLSSSITNVTAEESHAPSRNGWTLVFGSVGRHHQGQVTCHLQGIDRKTASLFVQEKGSVKVFGGNTTALKGQSVLLECQAAGWHPQPSLQWEVDGKKLSQHEYNLSSKETGKSLFTVSSNVSLMATRSSGVDCLASVSALARPLRSSVRLTVFAEVLQDEDDRTLPLALTSSLAALLLLLLLGICTVLCYRQRRQAKGSKQEALGLEEPYNGLRLRANATGGKVNLGYASEGITNAVNNELIMGIHSKEELVSTDKVPDLVAASNQVDLTEENAKNIRRVTTV
ncbi:immunoglobulin superfamily member 5 isoform X1 [Nerophis lumbriciformis]|uniref:immunoglobulin superfamily member 5 isoform X1 n=1 Tax=Nerophis lumbriciformis TaxID=546530 RepID=UPI002AE04647|nr:immunoglobulin superfamily member 5 isoform X1 [Nerophis lumbriciformis]